MELREPFNGWPGVPEPVKGRVENQPQPFGPPLGSLFSLAIPPPWQRMFDKLNHSPIQPSTHPYEQTFTESQVRGKVLALLLRIQKLQSHDKSST